jgi:WD40 repeat protein
VKYTKMASDLPLQPTYILRGHTSQIHALRFLRENTRLLTGDADGWLVVWSMSSRRPVAVWRAHTASILTLGSWGPKKIVRHVLTMCVVHPLTHLFSHGRDSRIRVWQYRESEEDGFSKQLPAETPAQSRKEPWLLNSVAVNTINFCSFSLCAGERQADETSDSVLIAVPAREETSVEIHEMPSEKKIHIVPHSTRTKASMIMALKLFRARGTLYLITGNEGGATSVQKFDLEIKKWATVYAATPHRQPILSLDVSSSLGFYYTCGADAVIARHMLLDLQPAVNTASKDMKMLSTGHSGQQSLVVRSDSKIFATAGWDARVRVYSSKSMAELAVLKWHKEGCYAVEFAEILRGSIDRHHMGVGEADARSQDAPDSELAESSETAVVKATNYVQHVPRGQQREDKTKRMHWLAAGAKDGKVSLWIVY